MKNLLIHFIFTLFHSRTPNFSLSLNRFKFSHYIHYYIYEQARTGTP